MGREVISGLLIAVGPVQTKDRWLLDGSVCRNSKAMPPWSMSAARSVSGVSVRQSKRRRQPGGLALMCRIASFDRLP